jgi:hypothetical protein
MNMSRTKLYDVPHKGLRNALSQLSLLAGKTDYSILQEVEELYRFGETVFKIMNIHAADENEVTLAELEVRCPGCSQHDMDDHELLHITQHKLEQLLSTIYTNSKSGQNVIEDGAAFHLALSEYHGEYLKHTAEEERVTQPLLWKYFTDDELAAQRGKIMAKNPPQTLLAWFRFVIPAQSHSERVGLLQGFKQMASVTFFNDGMETVKQVLNEQEFDKLTKALA